MFCLSSFSIPIPSPSSSFYLLHFTSSSFFFFFYFHPSSSPHSFLLMFSLLPSPCRLYSYSSFPLPPPLSATSLSFTSVSILSPLTLSPFPLHLHLRRLHPTLLSFSIHFAIPLHLHVAADFVSNLHFVIPLRSFSSLSSPPTARPDPHFPTSHQPTTTTHHPPLTHHHHHANAATPPRLSTPSSSIHLHPPTASDPHHHRINHPPHHAHQPTPTTTHLLHPTRRLDAATSARPSRPSSRSIPTGSKANVPIPSRSSRGGRRSSHAPAPGSDPWLASVTSRGRFVTVRGGWGRCPAGRPTPSAWARAR